MSTINNRTTLTISTGDRSYTVQGENEHIDKLFDRLVRETLNPSPVHTCRCATNDTDESAAPAPVVPDTPAVKEHPVEKKPTVRGDTIHSPVRPLKAKKPVKQVSAEESETEPPISNDTDKKQEKENSEVIENPVPSPTSAGEPVEPTAESESAEESETEPPKYRGFMLIKCAHCGEVKGFNARAELSSYKCDCDGETPLGKLHPLTALCECGKRWRYLTNITEDSFEMNCLHCGSPIPVFWNESKKKYETLLEQLPADRSKKSGNKGKKSKKK